MADEIVPAPAAEKKKAPPMALIVGVAVVVLGGGGWAFTAHQKAALEQAKIEAEAQSALAAAAAAAPKPDSFYDLDEFLVNLANPEGERYLRTTISLSFTHESERDAIKTQLPKVRDAIIDILSMQSTQALAGPADRAKLKASLLARLTTLVPTAGFDGVYFQLFTFQ